MDNGELDIYNVATSDILLYRANFIVDMVHEHNKLDRPYLITFLTGQWV